MLSEGLKVVVQRGLQNWNLGYQVWVFDPRPDGSIGIAEPLMMKMVPAAEARGMAYSHPTIELPPSAAQQLMDELWNTGLRPTEGYGSVGQLGAVQKHLEDMRVIAFAKVGLRDSKP